MVRLLSSIGRQSISIGVRVSELDSNNRLSPSSHPFCISFYSLLFYSFPSLLVLRFSYPPMIPKFLATVSFTRFARAHTHEYDASSILHLHTFFTFCSLFSFLPVQKIVLLLYFLLGVSCI